MPGAINQSDAQPVALQDRGQKAARKSASRNGNVDIQSRHEIPGKERS
jgi:hypothetical protein